MGVFILLFIKKSTLKIIFILFVTVNLNIIRKLALNVLKIYEAGKKLMSLKLKHFAICTNPENHLESIMNL